MIKITSLLNNMNFSRVMSPAQQKRAAWMLMGLSFLLPLLIWSWIDSASQSSQERKEQVVYQYNRALPLTAGLEAQLSGDRSTDRYRNVSPFAAVQQAVRDINLEPNLTSVRPASTPGGREGVRILVENLNLPQMISLFDSFQNQAGLELVSGNINKRVDNPQRVDITLLLTR
ncbi:hypothetical protein [Desulfonatronovibrio magnus]|uniref:hypothetical protein n=1 Tax=Desulfonatronovibrio magnus TaxID=698827 RepID=UPI0005EB0234|nr:hypothetical protein [Desulfonatronovibrio magnus]